jgi:hypothetical protein
MRAKEEPQWYSAVVDVPVGLHLYPAEHAVVRSQFVLASLGLNETVRAAGMKQALKRLGLRDQRRFSRRLNPKTRDRRKTDHQQYGALHGWVSKRIDATAILLQLRPTGRTKSRLPTCEEIPDGRIVVHRHVQIAARNADVAVPAGISNLGERSRLWLFLAWLNTQYLSVAVQREDEDEGRAFRRGAIR